MSMHWEMAKVKNKGKGKSAPAGAEPDPTFGLMPSTIEEVSNEHMAAFMATSGSGEVSPAASVE